MKKILGNFKIKHKLIMIIMSTVVFSLLLAGSVLIVSERYLAKQSMADKLIIISRIIADRSTAALSFNDKQVAREVLSALSNDSSVILGCIYDEKQRIFSVFSNQNNSECPKNIEKTGYKFWGERFELYQAVTLEGEVIGVVYILATLDKLNERILTFVYLVFLMILVVGIVAYLLANRQQGIISKPILELTAFAREISINGDYSTRLPLRSEDEIGLLNLAFNDMLETIDERQTERDKAEKALSEREQDLVVTLNSIGDAVIVTDINGRVTRMNPVAENLTGWTFEEASEQAINRVFPIINSLTQQPIESPVDEVVSSGETVFLSNHTTLITKQGKKINIADSAAPIRNKNNEILGMILVFNDVTEQYKLREVAAKSKRDLQAIMDNSPAAIHVEDTLGKFIFVNQKFENLFNIQDKYLIGKAIYDMFSQDIAGTMLQHNKEVLAAGHVLETEEIIPQEDGDRTYSSIKFPLYDEENNIYAVCSISTDITERRQQEEQLRRSQKMDALGKLTGGIAHDYNNLLGVIIGYTELLKDKLNTNQELLRYTNEIEHAAERGAKLTKKLLTFTRHKNADEKTLNINKLIYDQQLMLERTLTARITLKMELEKNIWDVWIDSGDLEDAIINMCINASHAINGGGQITFKTKNESLNDLEASALHLTPGDYVLLSIIDSGSGMSLSIREKIFDPFFSTKGEAGTGLGLSQVYGFVKRSGGDIRVESEPGQGARFDIYFPKTERSTIDLEEDFIPKKGKSLGDEVILVVDDEAALVELAKDILIAHGYSVFTANSGEAALDVLKNEKIDLMLSDVIMPVMDGYKLAEKAQKQYPELKIQLASGYDGGQDEYDKNIFLHDNLLYKPYASEALLEHIRNLLDNDKSSSSIEIETFGKINKILIMDDEEDVLDLFVLNLEMMGYRTVTANNSFDAIALYTQSLDSGDPVDALILDLNITGSLRGDEVALKIRSMNTDVKIIVCSGDVTGPEMTQYAKHGFDGALEKTFNREKIKNLLNDLSDSK